MQLKLLIDGVVRQTTVLIARLSTGQGLRSPLGRIADQVFLDLARELEQQGVSKVLVADMFGMALRSYQRKTQRLTESASENARSLWEAVYDFIRGGEVARSRIKERFRHDGEREVAAVLTDLVRSGFVFVTGSGDASVYGASDARLRAIAQSSSELDALAHYAWFKVFHGEAVTRAELMAELSCDDVTIDEVLSHLADSGRITALDGRLTAVNLLIPAESAEGAETALIDHFRAVTTVLADRVARGPDPTRLTGGSTFSFRLDRDHPDFNRVQELLSVTRERTQALWEQVMQHNAAFPPSSDAVKITFYLGQSLAESERDSEK
jgi:hypothetical protein